MQPDGSTFDFKQHDALHYVVYGLEPLILAALAAKAHHNRKKAGVKGYWGMWEAKDSASLYNLAVRLDSHWEVLANRLGKAQPWVLPALPLKNGSN